LEEATVGPGRGLVLPGHSALKLFTGFANAALIVCKPINNKVTAANIPIEDKKGAGEM